jgi:hypothetical protein
MGHPPQKKQTPAVPPRVELTIVARYDDPWPNEHSEVVAMRNGAWEPSSKTFREMVNVHKLTFFDCEDLDTFMGAILKQADGSVARINVISHGGPGLVSLGGEIELDSKKTAVTAVYLGVIGQKERNAPGSASINSPKTTADWLSYRRLDGSVMDWLTMDPAGVQYRDAIRKKLRPDAEIVLYACHAGLGPSMLLLTDIAITLRVTARGFNDEIRFDTTFEPAVSTPGKRDKVLNRRATHYQSGPVKDGFKHLTPDKSAPRPSQP